MWVTMFSAVSRSISSAFLSPTAVWFATASSSSASSAPNAAPAHDAAEDAELLVAGDERRQQQPVVVRSHDPGVAALAAHQVEQQRGAPRPCGRVVRRVGARQHQLVGLGVEPPDLTGVRAEQLARPARDRVVEVLAQGHRGERLAQLGQRGERIHPPALALVELGVLDRPGHQRRRVDQEVEHVVLELARRLCVEDHHADHVAVAGEDRHRDHRLEALLVELRHELHARVLERALADELGRLGARDPAGQPLVEPPAELAHQLRVPRRRGPQNEAVALHEVDEAGVAAGGVGGDLDDAAEHAFERKRRRDRLDDRVQRLVLAPHALEGVAALGDWGHCHASLLSVPGS